ncbi:membrane protein [Leminorella grimontii]|uniref:Membrane protein n=1 Tax=Leminorella grimontii TaxID=82981 RepID=A0AAV5N916_9GAMM|nr:anti-virulence regulator CigR family protein [Leminorella grimontii]KFC94436.1 putative inner membrane protein [Leminorella grimontii ATCC 33999 = DSM 5078]GKX57398.1 membrane protein [Leminorella grimontii]VFS54650.1 Predicted integral membrane protein [Leminorella grimontii]
MKKTMLTLLFLLPFTLASTMAVADNDKAKGNKEHQNSAHQNNGLKSNGKDKGNGKGNSGKSDKGNRGNSGKGHDSGSPNITITFDQARGLAVTHGLTGYSALPPGIAKNLARGKPLPPGIAKKAVPAGMLSSLPHYPGYEWYIAGDDLVLVAVTTAIVNTILTGVFN